MLLRMIISVTQSSDIVNVTDSVTAIESGASVWLAMQVLQN